MGGKMSKDERVARLREKLNDSAPRGQQPTGQAINVTGSKGVIIGNGNTINLLSPVNSVTRNMIDPTGGDLSPSQKQRLKDYVDNIVGASQAAGGTATHSGVWKRFQKKFRVNTYHALPLEQYEAAKKYFNVLYVMAKKGDV